MVRLYNPFHSISILRPRSNSPFCPRVPSRFSPLPLRRSLHSSKLVVSMEAPPPGYRPNVGLCLVNPSNKIFSASRLDVPGAWQMPQGGVDEGEDVRVAAMRELREETGVTSAEIISEVPYWLTYDFPTETREKLNKQWGSDWVGQAQKWFLIRFTGKEEEINLLGDGSEKPEFGAYSWMSPEQVIELAVDFKKPVYKEVMKHFGPHLKSDCVTKVCFRKECRVVPMGFGPTFRSNRHESRPIHFKIRAYEFQHEDAQILKCIGRLSCLLEPN